MDGKTCAADDPMRADGGKVEEETTIVHCAQYNKHTVFRAFCV